MILTFDSRVRLLQSDGSILPIVGECSWDVFKKLINADLLEVCETIGNDFLLIDEEGKPKGLDMNTMATAQYKYGIIKHGKSIDWIVGDAVFIPKVIYEEMQRRCEDDED